jgi:ribosomal protein S18 acetylase RimI-like enzyme
VFLAHISDRGIDGFVLGGERGDLDAAEHAFLRKHLFRCCLETLFHPRLWPAAYGTLRKLSLSKSKRPVQQPAPAAPALPRLLSIAVDASAEGSGAAGELVAAFESSISSRCAAYELSVVKTNLQAVRFYEKLGLTLVATASPKYFTFRREFKQPRSSSLQEP